MNIPDVVYFFLLGILGGAAHALMDAKSWEELTKFECIKSIILGGFTGCIYFFAYMQYNLPNQFMTIIAGYSGTDFLVSLLSKIQKKEEPIQKKEEPIVSQVQL